MIFQPDGNAYTDAHGETILLVEDEPAVREMLAQTIRGYGFHVLQASDGEDALDAAAAHAAPIHLVISDVVMPNMDGLALFATLRAWYPALRFLFVSGYPSDVPGGPRFGGRATAFLAKPFSAEMLYAAMTALLERVDG